MTEHAEPRKRLSEYVRVAHEIWQAYGAIGLQAPTDPDKEHPSKKGIGNLSDNQLRIEEKGASRRWRDLEWASGFYSHIADNLRRLEGADYDGMIAWCMKLSDELMECSKEHRQRLEAVMKEEESRTQRERRRSETDMFEELEALRAKVAALGGAG